MTTGQVGTPESELGNIELGGRAAPLSVAQAGFTGQLGTATSMLAHIVLGLGAGAPAVETPVGATGGGTYGVLAHPSPIFLPEPILGRVHVRASPAKVSAIGIVHRSPLFEDDDLLVSLT